MAGTWLCASCLSTAKRQLPVAGCVCNKLAAAKPCWASVLGAAFLWLAAAFLALTKKIVSAPPPPPHRSRVWTTTTTCRRMPRAWPPSSLPPAPPAATSRAPPWAAAPGAACAAAARWAVAGLLGVGGREAFLSHKGVSVGGAHLTVCRMPEACSEKRWQRRWQPRYPNNALMGATVWLAVSITKCTGRLCECARRATAPTTTLTLTTTEPCAA